MRRQWTDEEWQYVRDNYANKSSQEIADHLKRSRTSIYMAAQILEIKKSAEYIKISLEREAEKLKQISQDTRFKKGHEPQNKGQKMSKDLYQKVKFTFFKSGHEPHNTKFDGYERICSKDGYVYMRVNKGKFVLKHRKVWEDVNGPIPKGHIIIFKDGNKLNCDINNLSMITMKENMERNRITKYPEELQKLIKLNNKLKTKLHEKQN